MPVNLSVCLSVRLSLSLLEMASAICISVFQSGASVSFGLISSFSYFSQKTGFDISCKFCMKCQILFSGKNKKNISLCSLLKILSRVLSFRKS